MDNFYILPAIMILTGIIFGFLGMKNQPVVANEEMVVTNTPVVNKGDEIVVDNVVVANSVSPEIIYSITAPANDFATKVEEVFETPPESTSNDSDIFEENFLVYQLTDSATTPLVATSTEPDIPSENIIVYAPPVIISLVPPSSAPILPPPLVLPPSPPTPISSPSSTPLLIENVEIKNITRNSAEIFWQTNISVTSTILYGTSTDYGLSSDSNNLATSSSFLLTNLLFGTEYHFKIFATSSDGQATSTEDAVFVTSVLANYVVISEIKIGQNANDEWVELYNPTSQDIDLEVLPLKLHIMNSNGINSNAPKNKKLNFITNKILAHGFFLITSSGYATTATSTLPDATYASSSGNTLVKDGAVYISTSTTDGVGIIDSVGWGSQPPGGYESMVFSLGLTKDQSLERKAQKNATAETMALGGSDELLGNAYDTNNNAEDFVLQSNPSPQNSQSAIESQM